MCSISGLVPLMPSDIPSDFLSSLPHSRSASVCSSSSSAHSLSRPQSSQGASISASAVPIMPHVDDLYRPAFAFNNRPIHGLHSHTRHSSSASQSTAYSTDLNSPADSPPNHNLSNPALKGHLRPTHIRARNAASPYPRDAESVYSSSSETEDMAMFFNGAVPDYSPAMYGVGQHLPQSQEAMHAVGQFGRMTLGPEHALEQLAGNVRAATTTSASDRAKQIFVQAWLNANYAPYPDGNVPRQGLYFSYRRVCDQYGIPHINTATLGKAIRLCFPTIKTRRLGVRGNSKYHYCGIRPITATEVEWLHDYVRKSNSNSNQANGGVRSVSSQGQNANKGDEQSEEDDDEDGSEGGISNAQPASKRNSLVIDNDAKNPALFSMDHDKTPTTSSTLSQAQASQRPNYQMQATIRRHGLSHEPGLAMNSQSHSPPEAMPGVPLPIATAAYVNGQQQRVPSVRNLPNFPNIDEAVGSDSSSPHVLAARQVWRWFEEHLDSLLDSIRSFRFDQFELRLRTFWTNLNGDHREVVHAPAIAGLMTKADAIVYDEILEILRSQMLSVIPVATLTSLRQLADKMERILLLALENYGNTFVEPKVELGARFGHLVLRFLDIFQVTQALSTVLTNQKQLADMRRSWQNIDFESVRNQSALVCNCRHEDLVQLLEVDFVALLNSVSKSSEPVRDVMSWADGCCERLMGANRNGTVGEDRNTLSSRSVLIRWGYVTSQIMRDLTIRSDPAFGAFQILKLFLDDWIALNVLRSVALSTNSVQASVEPVIQQQFFTLSPMAGQESFGVPLDVHPAHPMMTQTPTTSSMLAALHDSFTNGPLDPSSSTFGDSFAAMSYLDSSGVQEEGMSGVPGMYADFSTSATPFDVASFNPHDIGMTNTEASTLASTDEQHLSDVKQEKDEASPAASATA